LRAEGDQTIPERRVMLETHRLFVVAEQQKWTQNLCNLDAKIEYYATMPLTTDQTEF